MAFLRNINRERFTVIDNTAVRDDGLSLKALGLLVKLLSLPDDWEFSENGLEAVFKQDGQSAIRSGLKELEKSGYLKRVKRRDDKGRIIKVEWVITENPHLENPLVENPLVDNPLVDNPHLENPNLDNPHLENRPQYNTNITKDLPNKKLTEDEAKQKRFARPSLDEVKAYCAERKNGVDPERFVDFYASKGWMVGKNKMKDWKAAVRNWERQDFRQAPQKDIPTGAAGGFTDDDFAQMQAYIRGER